VTALSDGVLATSLDVVLGMDRAEARRLAGSTDDDGVRIAVNAPSCSSCRDDGR
jgi:hypothetical protein